MIYTVYNRVLHSLRSLCFTVYKRHVLQFAISLCFTQFTAVMFQVMVVSLLSTERKALFYSFLSFFLSFFSLLINFDARGSLEFFGGGKGTFDTALSLKLRVSSLPQSRCHIQLIPLSVSCSAPIQPG